MDYFFLYSIAMINKLSKYQRLELQLATLLAKSPDLISQISTINAVLYHKIPAIFWVGVYFKVGNSLQIGPYQGSLACQILEHPKGVCWASIINKKTIIVDDVEKFPGHIACDSRSKSEIAIPIYNKNDEIIAVLDIDSDKLATFDETDKTGLEQIVKLLDSTLIDKFCRQTNS